LVALTLAGIATILVACGGSPPEAEGTPEVPRRIVSFSPNVSEILYALGLGDRVVGVDDWSAVPPGAPVPERLGGFVDPDLERAVALAPDLAVLLVSQSGIAEELELLGIEILRVDNQSLADVESSVAAVAGRAGVPEAGRRLLAELRRGLEPRPVARGRRVLLAVGTRPGSLGEIFVAGPASFHGELLARLGAENVFADLTRPYAPVAAEEVVGRSPGVVVELHGGEIDDTLRGQLTAAWQDLLGPEVEVVIIDGDDVLIPGPRLPRLYRRLAEALG
jgi:iron complex transport system substrate-binding protein